MRRTIGRGLLTVLTLAWMGCPAPNNPPTISTLEAEEYVAGQGARIPVWVEAEDPDEGDELMYLWTTDNCRIDYERGERPEEATEVFFRALPDLDDTGISCRNGIATVRITVVDLDGAEATESIEIDVQI